MRGVPIDCDAWRAEYDTATVADQKRWHAEVWEQFPDQSHFSAEPMAEAIARHHPKTVIELGGWDGEAAVTMLERFPFIEGWRNIEICEGAVEHGRTHPRYLATSPPSWFWEFQWTADMFVGAHVIEHLRADHLAAVIEATDAPVFYAEAPMFDDPSNWDHSPTLHRLEVGWAGVTGIFAEHGYGLERARDIRTKPESGGFSRCCTYSRSAA